MKLRKGAKIFGYSLGIAFFGFLVWRMIESYSNIKAIKELLGVITG